MNHRVPAKRRDPFRQRAHRIQIGILPQMGFLKQEEIPLDAFFKTKNGAYYLQHDRS